MYHNCTITIQVSSVLKELKPSRLLGHGRLLAGCDTFFFVYLTPRFLENSLLLPVVCRCYLLPGVSSAYYLCRTLFTTEEGLRWVAETFKEQCVCKQSLNSMVVLYSGHDNLRNFLCIIRWYTCILLYSFLDVLFQLLDLFSLESKPPNWSSPSSSRSSQLPSQSGLSMKTILDTLPDLWEDKCYEEEYDLTSFVKNLRQ